MSGGSTRANVWIVLQQTLQVLLQPTAAVVTLHITIRDHEACIKACNSNCSSAINILYRLWPRFNPRPCECIGPHSAAILVCWGPLPLPLPWVPIFVHLSWLRLSSFVLSWIPKRPSIEHAMVYADGSTIAHDPLINSCLRVYTTLTLTLTNLPNCYLTSFWFDHNTILPTTTASSVIYSFATLLHSTLSVMLQPSCSSGHAVLHNHQENLKERSSLFQCLHTTFNNSCKHQLHTTHHHYCRFLAWRTISDYNLQFFFDWLISVE